MTLLQILLKEVIIMSIIDIIILFIIIFNFLVNGIILSKFLYYYFRNKKQHILGFPYLEFKESIFKFIWWTIFLIIGIVIVTLKANA